ncbi:MAG: hypothetical protein AAF865_06530 [Pseudomonadota bacterium]
MPLFVFLTLLSLVLVAGVLVSSALVLQACAVDWPALDRFSGCPPESELAAEAQLAALDAERVTLERIVYDLERELAGTQCTATGPDPRRPIVAEGWTNRALPMIYGCWDVTLDYQTRDVDTDAVASYADWQMCFDAEGNGRQRMLDTAGVSCEGPVTAEFSENGLVLVEGDNLPCSDGGYIHRREILCQSTQAGGAVCSTLQPETGGAANIGLARR